MLTLSHVTKTNAGKLVLSDVSLALTPGSRLGVVGPNGIGKSTLLRIMAKLEEPDAGRVTWALPSLRVGYLPQEPRAKPGETALEYLARRTGVADAEAELDRLTAQLADDPGHAAAYDEALQRFLALGGHDLATRARAVATSAQLSADLDTPMEALSGGERARAALAALQLSRFDVFLLDEPTNDLDFAGLDVLERFVAGVRGAVVVVSHDRAFLDRTTKRIVELEDGTHRAHEYAGGWTEYEAGRRRARQAHERAFAEFDDERRRLSEHLGVRRAEARGHGKGAGRRGTHALMSKVRAVERRIDRLEEVEKPWEPWDLRLALEPERRSGDVVVRLEDAVVERGAFRLGPIDLAIGWAERVALAGPNGTGKTTLLRALLGELPLARGRRYVGPGVVLGELDQGRSRFTDDDRVLAAFRDMPVPDARSLLAKFGLGAEDVERRAASLSPGERTRAAIALLVAQRVNCLILDEPTNHLDVPEIEELETALAAYSGTVILVTHDRRFLEAFDATRTIAL